MPSESQQALLLAHCDRWAALCLSTEPCQRSAAEKGVKLAYASAGLQEPERIVWCHSPIEIAKLLRCALGWEQSKLVGRSVKSLVVDRVQSCVLATAKTIVGRRVEASRRKSAEDSRYLAAHAVREYVIEDIGATASVSRSLWRLLDLLSGRQVVDDARTLLSKGSFAPGDFTDLGICEFYHNVMDAYPFEGLRLIAANAGWLVPCEHTCWLAERPTTIRTDAKARLHCAQGPALRYSDGWSVYAWKGTRIPAWMIEEPDRITPASIDAEASPRLRRCMIDILTPERYVAMGAAMRVGEDETGVLWRKWWFADSWMAVEVVNGTPEADGTHKRFFLQVPGDMRSAREAVAWTYGMTAHEYATLRQRT